MLLGQVLEQLADDAFAAEAMVTLADLPLMARIEEAGRRVGESAAAYAASATRRFAAQASDDDWLALMTALERADDPGAACLRHMLDWSLSRDVERGECGCNAHGERT